MNRIKYKAGRALFGVFFALLACFTASAGYADNAIDDSISYFCGESADLPSFVQLKTAADDDEKTSATVSVFGVDVKTVSLSVHDRLHVIPGGVPFGIKLSTNGVIVVGTSEVVTENGTFAPGTDGGIKIKDIITSVNGKAIYTNDEFIKQIEASGGKPISIEYTRNGQSFKTKITPVYEKTEGKYKAGLWVKDSTAGIGTLTYIDPQNNSFGGLGHGVCDTDTGLLMPLRKGSVCNVTLSGVTKGKSGAPGELRGYFSGSDTGVLRENTVCGVFGSFTDCPISKEQAMPIALKDEISTGKAQIMCTTGNNTRDIYDIEIVRIIDRSSENKNFIIKVTDEKLIEETGGIVQGMSGSPIIQNGKLVGAVTHVLVNDPTKGYGIFIENMLKASE